MLKTKNLLNKKSSQYSFSYCLSLIRQRRASKFKHLVSFPDSSWFAEHKEHLFLAPMKVDMDIDGFGVSKDCLEYFDGQELGKEIFLLQKELIVSYQQFEIFKIQQIRKQLKVKSKLALLSICQFDKLQQVHQVYSLQLLAKIINEIYTFDGLFSA